MTTVPIAADAASRSPGVVQIPEWKPSELEQQLLDAYDRYQRLRLESALFRAQQNVEQGGKPFCESMHSGLKRCSSPL